MQHGHHRGPRVRLLGDLEVRRPDGTLVQAHEWRTGKTMDLLRLLALEDGRPVQVDGLLEKLWPDAPRMRGLGSLRTAASEIRRVLGDPLSVRRHLDGLALPDAWVDVVELRALHSDILQARDSLEHEVVLALVRRARSLYRGPFQAHDATSLWSVEVRDELTVLHLDVLTWGAESANAAAHYREAVEMASTAVRTDPGSESAHRTLMRAYAALGEIGHALRAYESYRRFLATELGADPSVQTQDLHLRLLRSSGSS